MTGISGIGFGVASLGSRISPREGLEALDRAYDAGVRWFDVAPSYGDGQAEQLLGRFLRGKRDGVTICTKVGILPPRPSLPKRLLRPLLRTAISLAPGLRATVKRHRPAATKPPLVAERIGQSLDASLQRLGTDYVDLLALHEATPEEVVRDDILRALEDVLASGKAKTISIASFAPSIRAGLGASGLYGAVQIANNPYDNGLDQIANALPPDRPVKQVTHSVYGASGMIDQVTKAIQSTPPVAQAFAEAGYTGAARDIAIAYLLDFALAGNPDGTVLLSMFSRDHMARNLARVDLPRDPAAVAEIAVRLRALPENGAR